MWYSCLTLCYRQAGKELFTAIIYTAMMIVKCVWALEAVYQAMKTFCETAELSVTTVMLMKGWLMLLKREII